MDESFGNYRERPLDWSDSPRLITLIGSQCAAAQNVSTLIRTTKERDEEAQMREAETKNARPTLISR